MVSCNCVNWTQDTDEHSYSRVLSYDLYDGGEVLESFVVAVVATKLRLPSKSN